MKRHAWTALPCGLLLTLAAQQAVAVDYQIQRVASGLSQPIYMAQAPGDPANIIYYMNRIDATTGGGGFSTVNNMGGIYRYDMNTRTSTPVMNLNYRQLIGDEGPQAFAFSPDFNIPGAPGYQKMYVSSSQRNTSGNPIDRVEEYTLNGANGTVPLDGSNHPVVSNLVLQYTHNVADANHTVGWIGFDPTAASLPVGTAARNYLYISTGDGAINASSQNRPEQQASSVAGKILRVDVDLSHGDAYGSDANKNFAIPSTNPIPLWNANHGASQQLTGTHLNFTGGTPTLANYTPALGEIFATGTRNQFRMSIDRQTGDLWMGDVGENSREEVNFVKGNPNAANNFEKANPYDGTQLPLDFGYASREGTIPTSQTGNVSTVASNVANSSGATALIWNLSGGGTLNSVSVNPIREGAHRTIAGSNVVTNTTGEIRDTGRSAYIGGYLYRGPIVELQGKYIWTDFVQGNTYALDFNRDTPLSVYSGTNFNQALDADGTDQVASLGTRTLLANRNLGSLWQTLVVDPKDPTYTSALGSFGMNRIVSFGEDNFGNLYILDFGGSVRDSTFSGFSADYPTAGTGEIFMLVPVPEPSAGLLLAPVALLLLRRRRRPAT